MNKLAQSIQDLSIFYETSDIQFAYHGNQLVSIPRLWR